MTTVYTSDIFNSHVTPPGHPERVDRLHAVRAALEGIEGLDHREAPVGAEADIERCHPQRYIDRVRAAIPDDGWVSLDGDTHVTAGSWDAAIRGVGANVAAVEAVLTGDTKNAFVACRPPGHHAERETAMGFCLFGNVAIAAQRALDEVDRVAIIDFDVHHGNGTQDLVWNEERVLFASTHQMPLYPGTGAPDERGAHDNVVNVPLNPGTGGAAMRQAYEGLVLPAVRAFAPEMILISAGFDAHANDPLANLMWTEDDFTWVTRAICDLADDVAGGRVVSTLEGGYDLDALGASAAAHVRVLNERGG
ncbi:MAG: histone deacetylase family protein [Pseudomonadota bacterium]